MIEDIAAAPMRMREAVTGLTPAQLDTHYRDGGWTLRQVVHHVPDSHLNAYIRFKLALTEESPTIKPYVRAGMKCGRTPRGGSAHPIFNSAAPISAITPARATGSTEPSRYGGVMDERNFIDSPAR